MTEIWVENISHSAAALIIDHRDAWDLACMVCQSDDPAVLFNEIGQIVYRKTGNKLIAERVMESLAIILVLVCMTREVYEHQGIRVDWDKMADLVAFFIQRIKHADPEMLSHTRVGPRE